MNQYIYKKRMEQVEKAINSSSGKFPNDSFQTLKEVLSGEYFESHLPNLYGEADVSKINDELIDHFYIYMMYFVKSNMPHDKVHEFVDFFLGNYTYDILSEAKDIIKKEKIIYMFLLDNNCKLSSISQNLAPMLKGIVKNSTNEIIRTLSILEVFYDYGHKEPKQSKNELKFEVDYNLVSSLFVKIASTTDLKTANDFFLQFLTCLPENSNPLLINQYLHELHSLFTCFPIKTAKSNETGKFSINLDSQCSNVLDVEFEDDISLEYNALKDYCTSISGYKGDKGTRGNRIPISITLSRSLLQYMMEIKKCDDSFDFATFIKSLNYNLPDLEQAIIFAYNVLLNSEGSNQSWVLRNTVSDVYKYGYSTLYTDVSDHFTADYASSMSKIIKERPYSLSLINPYK